jgi:hypothetical protein
MNNYTVQIRTPKRGVVYETAALPRYKADEIAESLRALAAAIKSDAAIRVRFTRGCWE